MNPSVNFVDLARAARLAGNDHFAALCVRLHDEEEDTLRRTVITKISSRKKSQDLVSRGTSARMERGEGDAPTDGKPTEVLETQRFTLSDRGETAVEDLFGVQLEGALGELEPLLDEQRELANTPSLLSQQSLCMCLADDDSFCRAPRQLSVSRSTVECRKQVDESNNDVPRYEHVLREPLSQSVPLLRVRG